MTEQEEFEFRARLEQEQKAAKPQRTEAQTIAQRQPGWLQGLASVAQGPTFGFADEIAGGVSALFGGDYAKTRDVAREMADIQARENPITSMVTRSMAAAPTMLMGGGGVAPTMTAQAIRAGTVGGATGALQGLGASTASDPMQMLMDTLKGGSIGAATGAGAVPVARAVGTAGSNVASHVVSRFNESAAARYAREKVAEALARDARGDVVQKAPTGSLEQALARFGKLGEEARVVDAGGQNTKSLLDTLAMLPGKTKDAAETAIRSRQAGRADRLIDAAEASMRTGGNRSAQVLQDLVEVRQARSAPVYARLHSMEIDADPQLAGILTAAEQLGAGKIGRDIATAAQVPYTLNRDVWEQTGGRLAMRDLDHMKQGLDTLIAKQTDPAGLVSPLGVRLQGLRARLLERLDDATQGAYKTARDAFAGPSALMDATQRGKSFMTADDASTRAVMQGLSESEREAFRVGAFETLRTKLGRPGGQTEVLGMWKDKILREKLRNVFPDERAFREFASTAAQEARLKGMETVGRGSQTAARQYAAGDLDVPALAEAAQAVSGSGGLLGTLGGVSRAWNRVGTPEPVRDAMGKLLLSQGQVGQRGLLSLDETLRQIHQNRMMQASGLGVLGGVGIAPGLLAP